MSFLSSEVERDGVLMLKSAGVRIFIICWVSTVLLGEFPSTEKGDEAVGSLSGRTEALT